MLVGEWSAPSPSGDTIQKVYSAYLVVRMEPPVQLPGYVRTRHSKRESLDETRLHPVVRPGTPPPPSLPTVGHVASKCANIIGPEGEGRRRGLYGARLGWCSGRRLASQKSFTWYCFSVDTEHLSYGRSPLHLWGVRRSSPQHR